ncbi:hypothetical protein RND71_032810 [Anisodus tanguticus]|uniref:Uncharacterized protein n=1 Tax=Anisodus tanguticus TaxID=243964 RepID=A0AAE1R730_9SOLA|nr:hypothetical protein RND71_032810 [Anisodus tanguticus]
MVSSKDDSSADSDNSSGDVPDSKPSLYSEGEKVLAYHGPRIYEAKALESLDFKTLRNKVVTVKMSSHAFNKSFTLLFLPEESDKSLFFLRRSLIREEKSGKGVDKLWLRVLRDEGFGSD